MPRVLITGCNSGFGLGAARILAERGDLVYATVRNPAEAQELRALAESGLPISIEQLDVRDGEAAADLVERVIADGGIDALVNNAGTSMFAAVEEVSVNLVKEMMEVNLFGPLRLIQLVLPAMRRQGHGHVVNVSSGAGFVPLAFMSTYSMTKHSLDALSFALSAETAAHGIRVSIISPGAFGTAVGGKLWEPDVSTDVGEYRTTCGKLIEDWHSYVAEHNPDPDTVSQAIADAVHDDAPGIRTFVGEDMEAIVDVRRTCDDDGWVQNMIPLSVQ